MEQTLTPTIDRDIELKKFLADIHSRINKDITSDFVLAKLEDKDKNAVIEMTNNAYYATRLLTEHAIKNKTKKKHYWNKTTKKWEKKELTEDENTLLKKNIENLFDAYVNRIILVVNLNRNKKDNHLLNLLGKYAPEPEQPEITTPPDLLENQENNKTTNNK